MNGSAACPQPPLLSDSQGRCLRYLRLSVTDRCNLRCAYCAQALDMKFIPHAHILRYEELLDAASLFVSQGIRKIRLTGGEPFVRKDFVPFLATLRERHPDIELRLTTNGTLLTPHIPALRDVRLNAVTISLDTLRRERFAEITGADLLPAVRHAVDAALAAGLRVKVNTVALRGVNDDELSDFLALAASLPIDLRFIEFMPMPSRFPWSAAKFWAARDILAEAERHAHLVPLPPEAAESGAGPARLYAIAGGLGRIGIIAPLSHKFCASCNRLRLTAEGRLRTCLFAARDYPLRGILRHPRLGLPMLRHILPALLRRKPAGHDLAAFGNRNTQPMSAIGG